jgi:hypothetical protein
MPSYWTTLVTSRFWVIWMSVKISSELDDPARTSR